MGDWSSEARDGKGRSFAQDTWSDCRCGKGRVQRLTSVKEEDTEE
jgi:hypothetical protein